MIENKYKNGKIYKIVDNTSDKYYIGSTTRTLTERLAQHQRKFKMYKNGKYNYVSSFEILQNNDYDIELVENYRCDNKEQLLKKEGEYIKNNNNCVNKIISGRTLEQYYQDNKDRLIEKQRKYYNNDPKKKIEYQKQYAEKNKEKVSEYLKEYREKNHDKILEQKRDYAKGYNKDYREKNKDYYKGYMDKYNKIYQEKRKELGIKRVHDTEKSKIQGDKYRENNKILISQRKKISYNTSKIKEILEKVKKINNNYIEIVNIYGI